MQSTNLLAKSITSLEDLMASSGEPKEESRAPKKADYSRNNWNAEHVVYLIPSRPT